MKKENFKTFMNVLSLVKNFNTDVVITNGKIFQVSDTRICLIDIDLSDLFDEEDYTENLSMINLNLRTSVLDVLNNALQTDDSYIRIEKVGEEYVRYRYMDSEFYVDFRLPNMTYLESLSQFSTDIRKIIAEIKDRAKIFSKTYTPLEARTLKDLQRQSGAKYLNWYYYNGQGIILIGDSNSPMYIKYDTWTPLIRPKHFNDDEIYLINAYPEILFPSITDDLHLEMFVYKDEQSDTLGTMYTKVTTMVDGKVPISIYGGLYIERISQDIDKKLVMRHFKKADTKDEVDDSGSSNTSKSDSEVINKEDERNTISNKSTAEVIDLNDVFSNKSSDSNVFDDLEVEDI